MSPEQASTLTARTVTDESSGTVWEPVSGLVGERGAIGFRVQGRHGYRYVYMVPSDGTDDGVANVFIYEGEYGNPDLDDPVVHIVPRLPGRVGTVATQDDDERTP